MNKLIAVVTRDCARISTEDDEIRVEIGSKWNDRVRVFSRLPEDPDDSPGGHFARIIGDPRGSKGFYFNYYGPIINYGDDIVTYERAVKSIKKIQKRTQKIYFSRGSASSAAVLMGRWLEACGVDEVWYASEGTAWEYCGVGKFVASLETKIIV